MTRRFDPALEELGQVLRRIDRGEVDAACALIDASRRIVVYGVGREGLQLRGFAMRLFQLGLDVSVHGEMTSPPVRSGDLLLVSAGPGDLATVTALMKVAREAGASILLLTAKAKTDSAGLADLVLEIPAETMTPDLLAARQSVLPKGSLYEGALFMLFEIMGLILRERLGIAPSEMRARQSNLE